MIPVISNVTWTTKVELRPTIDDILNKDNFQRYIAKNPDSEIPEDFQRIGNNLAIDTT